MNVPIGNDIALEIEFDFENRQSTFTHDWDMHDDDPGIVMGPYPYINDIADLHINRLRLWPESRGINDYWSIAAPGTGDFDQDGKL